MIGTSIDLPTLYSPYLFGRQHTSLAVIKVNCGKVIESYRFGGCYVKVFIGLTVITAFITDNPKGCLSMLLSKAKTG
jgi:hypothetical protein